VQRRHRRPDRRHPQHLRRRRYRQRPRQALPQSDPAREKENAQQNFAGRLAEKSWPGARHLKTRLLLSRSRAAELIAAGRVKWNGTVRRDPVTPVHLEKDRIEIDGQPVAHSSTIYLVLNKPRGIVTTAADEKGRDTVYSLLPENLPWLAPVGRLDKASEGLLLLTNDSEWGARITVPETHLDKTYHTQINTIADEALLQKLRNGIRASDGEFLAREKCARASPRRTQFVARSCSR